jgi:peptide chain release factor 1
MYGRYCKSKGWELEEIDLNEGNQGGIKSATIRVVGEGVFGHLRYESGIHRVQRFSATASKDIMHTSAATVVVLPEIPRAECVIKDSEVREDNFATGGPGGQNQNKSCSGVRLTHLPTGIVASIREGKSQLHNRKRAWQVLTARVSDHFSRIAEASEDATRRKLRGHGSRCEKIRTYNFPQDRITDHRIDADFHGVDKILSGELESVVQELISADLNDRS